jgi:hypothetical protein
MKNAACLFLASLLAVVVPACSGGGGSGGPKPNTNPPNCSMGTKIMASSANDYAFTSTMKLPLQKAKPKADLTLDWGSVTKDLLGHSLNVKTDINMVMVVPFTLSQSELEEKLNTDSLTQNDITSGVPLTKRLDGNTTTANLFAFDLNGNPVTPEQITPYFDSDAKPPASNTYALVAASGQEAGQGIRLLQAFQLDPSSSNTDIKMTDDSVKLTTAADLHSHTPTGMPKGTGAVTFDWGDMKVNGLGREFDPTQITKAFIGHYPESSGALEAKMIDLVNITATGVQLQAPELYEKQIEIGTSVDLSTLQTSGSKAFAGIDDTGTWMVALMCGMCRNPAPWYVSILKTCP